MTPPDALTQDEIDSLLSSLGGAAPGGMPGASAAPSQAASKPNATAPAGNVPDTSSLSSPASSAIITDNRNYKVYNFHRPDKFSKEHLRALQGIHEAFSRQLALNWSGYLRMGIDIEVISVDQLTYDEFVRSMPSPITVNIIEMPALPGQALLGYSHEVTTAIIDRMLGGLGRSEALPRELTDIEQALLKRCLDQTLVELEAAWQNVLPIRVNSMGMEDNYTLIQIATSSEIVALVTFEVTLGGMDAGLMSLCIPYPTLEGIMSNLSAQHIFLSKDTENTEENRQQILDRLQFAHLNSQVILGGTSMSVGELVRLEVGDVICLEKKVDEPCLVKINDEPKYLARPGRSGKHLAVVVNTLVDDVDELEGYGLE